ncbi:MAG: peptide chain release factor N(5)-glutamine methyltransferase [Phycisphaerales bacterium]|nr:MAG: peptide chain release factor N(5)-glutamine methyltransferase [Phycisphaerales bacterium]
MASDVGERTWTIGRLLEWTRDYLNRHGVDDPRLCAEVLLADALSMKRIDLYARFETAPDSEATGRLKQMVVRAARHEPVAYIVGSKEFFSLKFAVTPDVLIPRPETELLVGAAIEYARHFIEGPASILEIGTGSGCIIVSVLKHLPAATAVATDVSEAALAVAAANAKRHGVEARLRLLACDRLNLPPDAIAEGGVDMIVSNPPYVSAAGMSALPRNVAEHEPRAALTDGADGLSFYRALAEGGPGLLKPDGWLAVEVGAGQAPAVIEIITAGGAFEHLGTDRDRVEKHERVVRFVRRVSNVE